MDALLVKLFGEALSGLLCAVVGVVYDDLAAALEKVPDELLAAIGDALAEGHGLGGLFACDRVSDGGCEEGRRTEGKVVGREGLCAAEGLSAIVAEGDDVCLYAHPPQIALECARDVGLSAGRQSDGEDEDLARMPQQSRRSRVQRGRHQRCSQKLVITSCKVCYITFRTEPRLYSPPSPGRAARASFSPVAAPFFVGVGGRRGVAHCVVCVHCTGESGVRERNGVLTVLLRLARGRAAGQTGSRHRGGRGGMAVSVQEWGLPPRVPCPLPSRSLLDVLDRDIGAAQCTTRGTLTPVDKLAVVLGAGDGSVPGPLERDDGHPL